MISIKECDNEICKLNLTWKCGEKYLCERCKGKNDVLELLKTDKTKEEIIKEVQG